MRFHAVETFFNQFIPGFFFYHFFLIVSFIQFILSIFDSRFV